MKTYLIGVPWETNPRDDVFPNYEVRWLQFPDLTSLSSQYLQIWRRDIKEKLDWVYGAIRPRTCLVCGKPFTNFDMHEGIVWRNDVQGWKKPTRLLIMTEVNCIPLHHTCHLQSPPTREQVWEYQKQFYSEELLYGWYTRLPWKIGVPRKFW